MTSTITPEKPGSISRQQTKISNIWCQHPKLAAAIAAAVGAGAWLALPPKANAGWINHRAVTVVGGSTDSVVGVEDGSMAAAGHGATVGVMGAVADGSTAARHLYRRPPLERVPRFSARLRKRSGNSNRFSNRQKSWPSTLENPDAHLPCRSLSTIRTSQRVRQVSLRQS